MTTLDSAIAAEGRTNGQNVSIKKDNFFVKNLIARHFKCGYLAGVEKLTGNDRGGF